MVSKSVIAITKPCGDSVAYQNYEFELDNHVCFAVTQQYRQGNPAPNAFIASDSTIRSRCALPPPSETPPSPSSPQRGRRYRDTGRHCASLCAGVYECVYDM